MILIHPEGELSAAVWIDLVDPTTDEAQRAKEATGLRVPDLHDISEIESSSRLAFDKGAYYLSAPFVSPQSDGELTLAPVGFVLSAKVLLTVRYKALPSFDAAHQSCSTHGSRTAEESFLYVLESVVDRGADKLEVIGAECDKLARSAFRSGAKQRVAKDLRGDLERVGAVAEHASRIRDALLGLGRIAAFVLESGVEGAPSVNAARMRSIRTDITSLTDYEAHLSNKVQFLLDATLGFINIEQNEIVKTLTIASVVGIPPVLIVGIYGMNFRYMPELNWQYGYPLALGLLVVSALLPLIWFKRRGWM
jgi:magnesium transporter